MDDYLELVREVASILGRSEADAALVIEAAEPLWRALEPSTDAYGGAEFYRVFPEAIRTIHREANPLLYEEAI